MLFYLLLACDNAGNLSVPEVYSPEFVVTNKSADESCARLTDYCIRVSCSIKNTGNASGEAAIELTYIESPEKTYTETIRKTLKPGDSTSVEHNFKQAKLFGGSSYKYTCYAR